MVVPLLLEVVEDVREEEDTEAVAVDGVAVDLDDTCGV